MTNEEETEIERTTEEPVEIKADPELRRMVCAGMPPKYIRAEDD